VNSAERAPKVPWWSTLFLQFPTLIFSKIGVLLPQQVRRNIAAIPDKWLFYSCTKRQFSVWTFYCFDQRESERFFSTCKGALTLLFESDPRRYRRVECCVRNIVLFPGLPGFSPSTESCFFDDYNPDRSDSFALTLVHEATHGYLFARGLRYDLGRRRHEYICLKEQERSAKRMFLRANPNVSNEQQRDWLHRWRRYFDACMASEWWEPHHRRLAQVAALRNLRNRIHT
jgi:hypothetical protein